MVFRDTIFLFFPSIVKGLVNFFDEQKKKKIRFIKIDSLDKEKLRRKEEEGDNYWLSKEKIWDNFKKELEIIINEEKKEEENSNGNEKNGFFFNKIVILVEYPEHLQQIKTFLLNNDLIGNSLKHFVLVNIVKFDLIRELQDDYWICPLCELLHKSQEKRFFCEKEKIFLKKETMISFNKQNMENYLTYAQEIMNELLKEIKVETKTKVSVETKEEVFNGELFNKVLSIIKGI